MPFQNQVNLVLYIIEYNQKDLKLYIRVTLVVKGQQAFSKPHQSIESQDRSVRH